MADKIFLLPVKFVQISAVGFAERNEGTEDYTTMRLLVLHAAKLRTISLYCYDKGNLK